MRGGRARDTRPARPGRRAFVLCTYLRPGRDKRRTRYFMQPITGLHVASLIDQRQFDVRLRHEDWHGPLDPAQCSGYDLVFHCFIWSSETPSQPRTYVAGDPTLDPQYFERPDDLSEADRIRYFEPIMLTDSSGQAAEWLLPHIPAVPAPAHRTASVAR
jgi:hypothetical protein